MSSLTRVINVHSLLSFSRIGKPLGNLREASFSSVGHLSKYSSRSLARVVEAFGVPGPLLGESGEILSSIS